MIKTIEYQSRAVDELVAKTLRLLELEGNRKKLIFKSPTGSGKTVMACEMLGHLVTTLADSCWHGAALLWIAPNKLHQQSYMKMHGHFAETRTLRPVMYDELDHSATGYIKPGEVLFTNWDSINKDTNLMVRGNERGDSLDEICQRTREQGLPLIVIVDEAHSHYGNSGTRKQKEVKNKSQQVLERLQAKVEILMSATIDDVTGDDQVTVTRQEVIEAQMIKEGIVLNPKEEMEKAGGSLTEKLVDDAMKRRELLAEAYKAQGSNINPLLLIQLPNDGDSMDSDDHTVAEDVKDILRLKHGVTLDNGLLAVWLTGDKKQNLTDIENPCSPVQVLLFKQAIAMGWDCPRAAVLLIFRKLESHEFTMQVLGRILRMPEQRHYADALLNRGYVYTNLSHDMIKIAQGETDYITPLYAKQRAGLQNVVLTSVCRERLSQDRARLLPDFKEVLWKHLDCGLMGHGDEQLSLVFSPFDDEADDTVPMADTVGNRMACECHCGLTFDVREVTIEIPVDVHIDDLDASSEIHLDSGQRRSHAHSQGELRRLLEEYCHRLLTQYEKQSLRTLTVYLMEYVNRRFGLSGGEALRLLLFRDNWPHFEAAISDALRAYLLTVMERQAESQKRAMEQYSWQVPEERLYDSTTHHPVLEAEAHALLPFVKLNDAKSPEDRFEAFLETHRDKIDWWYKNGDKGRQHYAVPYTDSNGLQAPFYVDYIIRCKNGQMYLFDTKTQGSDPEAPAKHNALLRYIEAEIDKHLRGGVLIEDGCGWRYSKIPITNTNDISGWSVFVP